MHPIKIIEEELLDFLVFGYTKDDEDTQYNVIQSKDIIPMNIRWIKGNGQIVIDGHHLGLLGYAWNKIYRRSFLNKHRLRFEKGTSLIEDILFNSKVYQSSYTIRFNKNSYYHYLNRPVITLMKTFHSNSFELKKQQTETLDEFFKDWGVKNRAEILSFSIIQGIRYCIHNLFSYKNQLSLGEKMNYVSKMYNDEITRKYISLYDTKSLNDKLYKFLIKNKMILITCLIAKMIK